MSKGNQGNLQNKHAGKDDDKPPIPPPFEGGEGPRTNFQSEEAAEAAARKAAPAGDDDDGELESAEVGSREVSAKRVAIPVVEDKPVRVTPRVSMPKFRIGKKTYSVTKGKDTIVPTTVARMMREKGLL